MGISFESVKMVAAIVSAAMCGVGVGALSGAAMLSLLRLSSLVKGKLGASLLLMLLRAVAGLSVSMVFTLTFLFVESFSTNGYLSQGVFLVGLVGTLFLLLVLLKRITPNSVAALKASLQGCAR